MSTECERVFSSAKKFLTPERNAWKRGGKKTWFNYRSRDSEIYDSEVDSINSRVNGKAIGNGDALTATAKRAQ
jgi:hypothetical protein